MGVGLTVGVSVVDIGLAATVGVIQEEDVVLELAFTVPV